MPTAPTLISQPGPEYATAARRWQGIPGIERAANGRLWATWYTGGPGEGPGNHCVLVSSGDDGATWSEPVAVLAPPAGGRVYDPCLWCDPLGQLWWFAAQSLANKWHDGAAGVWTVLCETPDAAPPAFSAPRYLAPGVMMNKPTVTAAGEWLAPIAVWGTVQPFDEAMAALRFSSLYASTDQGATWTRRGGADVPDRAFDEHMVVELRDGRLWLLVRAKYGIGESFSSDGGRTWTPGQPARLTGPNSRFFIRRLASGRLLLVNHAGPDGTPYDKVPRRSNLRAWLSADDGATWQGSLLLDDRWSVSYPDGVQAPDGRIYIIYDWNRGDQYAPGKERQILMAVLTEADILAGHAVSPACRLRQIINQVL